MQCEYRNRHGNQCEEVALTNSKYCVLHTPLPEDKESEKYECLRTLKERIVKWKVDENDFDFQGARLAHLDLEGKIVHTPFVLEDSIIDDYVNLRGAQLLNYWGSRRHTQWRRINFLLVCFQIRRKNDER